MGERILVVDDNRDAADSLAKLIQSLGYEARAVYGGKQAHELARADAGRRIWNGELEQ